MVQRKSLSFCLWKKKNVCCAFFFLLLKIKSPIALATIQPCNFDHRLVPYKGNQRQKRKKNTKIYNKCRNVYGFFLLPVSCSSLTRSFCSFCLNFSDHSLSLTWCLSGICVGCFVYFSHSHYIDSLSLTLFLYRARAEAHITRDHTYCICPYKRIGTQSACACKIHRTNTLSIEAHMYIHKNIKHFLDTV